MHSNTTTKSNLCSLPCSFVMHNSQHQSLLIHQQFAKTERQEYFTVRFHTKQICCYILAQRTNPLATWEHFLVKMWKIKNYFLLHFLWPYIGSNPKYSSPSCVHKGTYLVVLVTFWVFVFALCTCSHNVLIQDGQEQNGCRVDCLPALTN